MKPIDADEFERRLIEKGFYPAIVRRTIEEMPILDIEGRIYNKEEYNYCSDCEAFYMEDYYIDENGERIYFCNECIGNTERKMDE